MPLREQLPDEFKLVLGDLLTPSELIELLGTSVYDLIELLEDEILVNLALVKEAIGFDDMDEDEFPT